MINRLRNKFIRIAMLSVAAVMLLLTLIVNVAYYISTDSDLRDTLTLIYENQGTIPISDRAPSGVQPMLRQTDRHRRITAAPTATSVVRSRPKLRSRRAISSCATTMTASFRRQSLIISPP